MGPEAPPGYIFFGVADKQHDADRIRALDGVEPRKVADHFLVGIEREAAKMGISVEAYVRKIVVAFQNSALTDPLKTQILGSFDPIVVHNMTVIRITIPIQKEVSFVGGKAFYREGSSTVEVEGPKLLAISKLFSTK